MAFIITFSPLNSFLIHAALDLMNYETYHILRWKRSTINSSLFTQSLYCDVILSPRSGLTKTACLFAPTHSYSLRVPLPTGGRHKAILLTLGHCDTAKQKAAEKREEVSQSLGPAGQAHSVWAVLRKTGHWHWTKFAKGTFFPSPAQLFQMLSTRNSFPLRLCAIYGMGT